MKKAIVFMNHHVHEKKTSEPIITIQYEGGRIYCNKVKIKGPSTVEACGEHKEVMTHKVRGWVECDFDDIEIIS